MPLPLPLPHTHTQAKCCHDCIRVSLCFLYWWAIPVGVHLSDFCTIAALSQCVMSSNRFVKWVEAGDDTNNDALCLPFATHQCASYYSLCICLNQAQRVLRILCSALVLTFLFKSLCWLCFHSKTVKLNLAKSMFSSAGGHEKELATCILYSIWNISRKHGGQVCTVQRYYITTNDNNI